jgi:uncharacterized protein with FMN-binding domain
MLSSSEKRESLAGKLLLSSALVAVSLAYGWWQNPSPKMAAVPIPATPAPQTPVQAASGPAALLPAAKPDAGAPTPTPSAETASSQPDTAPAAPKAAMAMSAPSPSAPTSATTQAAPSAQQQETALLPAAPPTLSQQAALQMYMPTDAPSPPLPPVTGTPAPGATAPIPSGTHLQDGDYFSDKQQYEWGDLMVKISVRGGQITGVQFVRYPDHRSQSLYLSQMASPTLASEVIKTQQSKVDAVSSATDTSYAYQDAIANAIVKATR